MPSKPISPARLAAQLSVVMVCGMLGFACSSDVELSDATSAAVGVGGSDASNPDASSTPSASTTTTTTTTAEPLGCGLGAGNVDRQQLGSTGNIEISGTQLPGQSFTLQTSGVLAGLEFGLASCNGVDPAASVQLTLSRAGNVIATTSIPATRLGTQACTAIALNEHSVGAGFFDFTGQCVTVNAGETLTATLSIVGSSGRCGDDKKCVSGANAGSSCRSAEDCAYTARAGDDADAVAAGTEVVNGEADAGFDLAFKAFVR